MDWTTTAVHLFCAAFVLYVACLLSGFCYELAHKRPDAATPENPKSQG